MSDPTDAAFDAAVDQWILQAAAAGAASFEELLVTLPGVYPTVIRVALDRLKASGKLPSDQASRLRQRSRTTPPVVPYRQRHQTLPPPHPLDYDWRFTPEASAFLLREGQRLTIGGSDPLTLLGLPSVFLQAARTVPSQPMALLDDNPAVIAALQPEPNGTAPRPHQRAVRCDLRRDPLPDLQSGAVLMDPPWYDQYIRLFLWAAAAMCRIDGHILLSFPPVGTRPGMPQAQNAMLEWATALGLELTCWTTNALSYTSPPFEQNALAAAGLADLPDGWRRGDLVSFSRTRTHPTFPARPSMQDADAERWSEVVIQGVRLRFRDGNGQSQSQRWGDPALRSIVSGDVLDSVSRRWPRRGEIQVWTSTNRVFACRAPGILRTLIAALAADDDPYRLVEQQLHRSLTVSEREQATAAIRQAYELISAERHDLARLGWVTTPTKQVGSAEPAA